MFTQNSATGARVTVNLSVLVRDWRERYVPVLDVHVWMSCHVAFDGGIKLFGCISVLLFITSSVWAIDLGCSKILNLKKRCHFLWLFFFFNKAGNAKHLRGCSVASAVSDFVQLHRLQPTRLVCPWDSPGKNAGVGCPALLQGIFPTQGLNWSLCIGRRVLGH